MKALDEIYIQLEEIITLLQRLVSTERTGAVSSVEIEDLVGKPPKVTTKNYTGSVPPVDEAIEDHIKAKQLADEAWRNDWQMTVDQLRFKAKAGDRSS